MSKSEDLALTFEFDAPPEKVWRAVSISDYRERWLPEQDLAQADPVEIEDGSAVSYRMREIAPPHEESVVTFTVADNGSGGTRLEIVQRLIVETPVPANSNGEPVMMAA